MSTISELANRAEAYIREQIDQGKGLRPVLFIYLRETIFTLPFKDPDDRKEMYWKQVAIRGILEAREKGIFSYATSFSEAWVSTGKNLGPLSRVMKPSQDPDRIEAVVMQVWNGDGKSVIRVYELLRTNSKKSLGKMLMSNENNEVQVESWLDPAFVPLKNTVTGKTTSRVDSPEKYPESSI